MQVEYHSERIARHFSDDHVSCHINLSLFKLRERDVAQR